VIWRPGIGVILFYYRDSSRRSPRNCQRHIEETSPDAKTHARGSSRRGHHATPTTKGDDDRAVQSETTTTATSLSAGAVGRCWGDVLDSADLHSGTSEGTEGRLGTRAGGLGTVTSGGANLDVQGVDAQLLAASSDILGSQHGGVGGRLVTVGLDLHTTSNSGDGFAATEIGDVDEGIVEGGENSGDTEDELTLSDLGAEGDVLLRCTGSFLGRHCVVLVKCVAGFAKKRLTTMIMVVEES